MGNNTQSILELYSLLEDREILKKLIFEILDVAKLIKEKENNKIDVLFSITSEKNYSYIITDYRLVMYSLNNVLREQLAEETYNKMSNLLEITNDLKMRNAGKDLIYVLARKDVAYFQNFTKFYRVSYFYKSFLNYTYSIKIDAIALRIDGIKKIFEDSSILTKIENVAKREYVQEYKKVYTQNLKEFDLKNSNVLTKISDCKR